MDSTVSFTVKRFMSLKACSTAARYLSTESSAPKKLVNWVGAKAGLREPTPWTEPGPPPRPAAQDLVLQLSTPSTRSPGDPLLQTRAWSPAHSAGNREPLQGRQNGDRSLSSTLEAQKALWKPGELGRACGEGASGHAEQLQDRQLLSVSGTLSLEGKGSAKPGASTTHGQT